MSARMMIQRNRRFHLNSPLLLPNRKLVKSRVRNNGSNRTSWLLILIGAPDQDVHRNTHKLENRTEDLPIMTALVESFEVYNVRDSQELLGEIDELDR